MMRNPLWKKNKGFTIVELMVSILIAMVIFAGVVGVVQTSAGNATSEQASSFIQENARYASEILTRDIRQAGNFGCADLSMAHVANVVENPANFEGLFAPQAISGSDSDGTAPADFPAALAADSDLLVIRYADPEWEVQVSSYSKPTFETIGSHNIEQSEVGVVVDSTCRYLSFFSADSVASESLNHSCADAFPHVMEVNSCAEAQPSLVTFEAGSIVMPLAANMYFVEESNILPGVPALKRRVIGGNSYMTEELAQGIERIDFFYGEDTDASPDGDPDQFVSADDVSDWQRVVAVRYSMVLRSQDRIFGGNQTVNFEGTAQTDGFLRQRVASTVTMRNR